MKTYKHMILALVMAVFLMTAACASQPEAQAEEPQADTEQTEAIQAEEEMGGLELTLEQLAEFNGKDGSPAYVAVEGVIYDVSGSAKWKDGEHNGNSAGQDLTDVITNQSPHGVAILKRMPIVGKIVE